MSSHVQRLISIVDTLSAHQAGVTIACLAKSHGISDKTVRRDLVCLKKMGFQLIESLGVKGKKHYRIKCAPRLAVQLGFDEALALFVGCHTLAAYQDLDLGQAGVSSLHKLRAALGPLESRFIDEQLPKFHRSQVASQYAGQAELLNRLQLAVEDCQAVQLTYRSATQREPVRYEVHPYGLLEHRGSLYMVGYSLARSSIRVWKLDRVTGVELTDRKFEVPEQFNLRDYLQDAFALIRGDKLVHVKIRFHGSAVRYVQEKQMHASQRCHVHEDGTATVEFQLSSILEVKSWILSFGSQAEVLEPAELRDQIAAEIAQLAEIYRVKPPPQRWRAHPGKPRPPASLRQPK